jgi:pimeloyl-ACP methyl ester carboxylesterase
MSKFERETHVINGVKTVVYTAGHGEPVVFFHGGGTVDGFDFAEPWTSKFRVIVPYHPGFGESGDEPSYTSLQDYVMHYLELFDVLKLDRFSLVGLSLGGQLAALFASQHGHRLKKLALIAPVGMIDPQNPMIDLLAVPGDQLAGMLVSDFEVLKKRLPEKPDLDFIGER